MALERRRAQTAMGLATLPSLSRPYSRGDSRPNSRANLKTAPVKTSALDLGFDFDDDEVERLTRRIMKTPSCFRMFSSRTATALRFPRPTDRGVKISGLADKENQKVAALWQRICEAAAGFHEQQEDHYEDHYHHPTERISAATIAQFEEVFAAIDERLGKDDGRWRKEQEAAEAAERAAAEEEARLQKKLRRNDDDSSRHRDSSSLYQRLGKYRGNAEELAALKSRVEQYHKDTAPPAALVNYPRQHIALVREMKAETLRQRVVERGLKYREREREVRQLHESRMEAKRREILEALQRKEERYLACTNALNGRTLERQAEISRFLVWMSLASRAIVSARFLVRMRAFNKEMAERTESVKKIQRIWRWKIAMNTLARRHHARRVIRKNVALFRLMFRVRSKKKKIDIIKTFITEVANSIKIPRYVHNFVYRVKRLQRWVRVYLPIRDARLRVISLRWDQLVRGQLTTAPKSKATAGRGTPKTKGDKKSEKEKGEKKGEKKGGIPAVLLPITGREEVDHQIKSDLIHADLRARRKDFVIRMRRWKKDYAAWKTLNEQERNMAAARNLMNNSTEAEALTAAPPRPCFALFPAIPSFVELIKVGQRTPVPKNKQQQQHKQTDSPKLMSMASSADLNHVKSEPLYDLEQSAAAERKEPKKPKKKGK